MTFHNLSEPPTEEFDTEEPELQELNESTEDQRIEATPPQGTPSFPAIWSEEGKYLATVLGDALVKGLTQVSQDRPDDPVEYLANFLKKYRNGEVLASEIPEEVQERLRSGRAVTPGLVQRALQGTENAISEEEQQLDIESAKLIQSLDSDSENEPEGSDEINKLDEVESENEEEAEDQQAIRQSGTRDDRGQSVLHFAAARPGGASTILAFLQNPSVNLAWRDEQMRTARDIAVGLGRTENVRTIDGWIVSLAVAGEGYSL